jgi:hypothetical protein
MSTVLIVLIAIVALVAILVLLISVASRSRLAQLGTPEDSAGGAKVRKK